MSPEAVFETALRGLRLLHRGKVRDLYELDEHHLLMVATDRLSAFDVVLPDPIPGKGRVLTQISSFWFERTRHIVPNHLTDYALAAWVHDPQELALLEGRAVVVKRLRPLPVEAVVRGYLIGSGWKDYQANGSVCGIALPSGLRLAERLPGPIFTPAQKAQLGQHDENIPFDEVVRQIGGPLAFRMRSIAIALYQAAADYAATRGILIADTKFEFGLDADGQMRLMDEVLTADSSRFWPADEYSIGYSPPSFDKQFVRDWLERQPWNKAPPPPDLPPEIVASTADKYREALIRLTGHGLPG